jgi:hypothetical protein
MPDNFLENFIFQKTLDNAILECKKQGQALAAPDVIEENICIQWMILENGKRIIFSNAQIFQICKRDGKINGLYMVY